jgi:hypothetical protein
VLRDRPPTRAMLPSLYASLAGKANVHLRQPGGSAPPSCQAALNKPLAQGLFQEVLSDFRRNLAICHLVACF